MTITTLDTARLASAFGSQAVARVKNDSARQMALALVATQRARRVTALIDSADAWRSYSADDETRMRTLMAHVWPRARRVRAAIHTADAASRDAHMRKDHGALYDAVLRAHRLSVLASILDAQATRVGAFPLSRRDLDARTSRFLVKAAWRRFMFKGGRDVGSREFDNSDVLQGAFLRALDAGDTANGVPTFGSMFRHVQAERAHLTRITGAEWRGIMDALHGVKSTERAYADTDDKHAMRRLGATVPAPHALSPAKGRHYGTRDTHAAAMALAEVETMARMADETVTHEARSLAVLAGRAESFGRVLAEVLMSGATLAEVSAAIGLNESTLKDRALAERDAAMASGLDHTADDMHAAERERNVMLAQERHAAAMRERHALARRALSVTNRRAASAANPVSMRVVGDNDNARYLMGK